MRSTSLCLLVSILCSPLLLADWPQFRGPDGQGHSDAEGVPLRWSETKNITWKTRVPGEGWSSPVISGNQIWMTSAHDKGRSLHAVCVDRISGKILHDIEYPLLFLPGKPGDFLEHPASPAKWAAAL